MKNLLIIFFILVFMYPSFGQVTHEGDATINGDIIVNGSANINGKYFRISENGTFGTPSLFGIYQFKGLDNNPLRARFGVNYSLNSNNGITQYAISGNLKTPLIELDAQLGSISLYGENGSGSNFRNPNSTLNLGIHVAGNGKVGIGITNPLAKLHVETDNTDHSIYVKNQTITSNFWPLYIESKYTRSSGFISKPTGIELQLRDAAGVAHIGLRDNGVSFLNGGTVGIGLTNPNTSYDLQVQGNSDFKEAISFKNNKEGRITWGSSAGGPGSFFGMIAQTGRALSLGANGQFDHIVIRPEGNIGVGTSNPDSKLTVKGLIHSEEVKIDLSVPGPDYVFEEDYDLISLEETKAYIDANKHLPEVPSAKEMEANGVELGDMSMILLKKIEEMTLHQIKLMEEVKALKEKVKELEK